MADTEWLAKTWNGNSSGLLWERLWGIDDGGYLSQVSAPGVFVGPQRYASPTEFWAEFGKAAEKFNGKLFSPD